MSEEKMEDWCVTLEYDVTVKATSESDAIFRAKAYHHSKGGGACYDTGVWQPRSLTSKVKFE